MRELSTPLTEMGRWTFEVLRGPGHRTVLASYEKTFYAARQQAAMLLKAHPHDLGLIDSPFMKDAPRFT